MDGVVVVGFGRIAVGNGDRLIVFDGVGEVECNGGAGDGNRGNGIGIAVCCDGEGGGACCCVREGFAVGEEKLGAVSGCGSGDKRWCGTSNR